MVLKIIINVVVDFSNQAQKHLAGLLARCFFAFIFNHPNSNIEIWQAKMVFGFKWFSLLNYIFIVIKNLMI
ncbi:hypothetical protein F5ESL0228_07805 [Lactobacillus sp. ESL0228]|nr:hypothetical protein F5ESL0228_07805 [Lactobacillus sp. ESL0228]